MPALEITENNGSEKKDTEGDRLHSKMIDDAENDDSTTEIKTAGITTEK